MLFLLWVAILFIVLVLYYREVYSRFRKHDVKCSTPYPIVGNIGGLVMKTKHGTRQLDDTYYKFREQRFYGRYLMTKPMLMIRDLELVKNVTVKDFEYFLNHEAVVDESMDPLFGRNLFSLKGQEWKDMRSTLSPAFTSSKMRLMVPLMMEVSDMMMKSLKKNIKESGVDFVDVDCKNLTRRYANDVIASCAFGLKVDSHTDVDNEFYNIGKDTATFTFRRSLIMLGHISFPWLMKKLPIRFFSDQTTNFFKNIILETMKERDENNIIRPDMIHLLMEAKKGRLKYDEQTTESHAGFATVEESQVGKGNVIRELSDNDLMAQAVLFFMAGFETVSTAMAFLLHELATNPDVQERLVQEIKEHDINNGGKFDFSSIQNLTYLDMVVSETLRLWPPAIAIGRVCVKDYNLGKPNKDCKEDFIIRKNESLAIPIWCFHHDPEYFPDPYRFDAERFSEENKHKIKPFSYLPFGLGPRNCIGSRFALCEMKVMVYQLLQQMEISPCEKTQIPVNLKKDTFNIEIQGGHWARFKLRK